MVGTKAGALKARETIYNKFGNEFYKNIGKIGGETETSKPKGFACNPKRARIAGAKGGHISKRGKAKNNVL